MIKFFRHIRQTMINQNRTKKYLLYAIGEIILVVIGILIALQINNWNENRKNQIIETSYLQNLLKDLKRDSVSYVNGWVLRYDSKLNGLRLAKDYFYGDYKPKDTIEFVGSIGKGGIGSIGGIPMNDNTFRDLISTGNLSLIQNEAIRNSISGYYSYIEFSRSYLDNLKTDYAGRINSLIPYVPSDPKNMDPRDLKLVFKSLKQPDFIGLINQEITYGHALNRRYVVQYKESLSIRDSIVNYLNKNR
ncbi:MULTISPECIES: DUF6090 family protein [Winogradskyella]|uniref:Uncharacterized protein n=1 Tax=Winogradskyella ouciana TaxID=2608631 RepID=A0A7K1GEY0_9FLAO|nr:MULTISPECIES: DUF6090 family protein [Winogradskyella]MBO6881376.1 hypothetical protein [Winogradskyella sp.]MTE27860.1 hypothetical protein [Winogradskyella ouciana]